mmetsp:Transcript_24876/g.56040  ORF Transcript_24876/g.56040 Transcript_24876/m.56040 type:complete len:234 (+) Transcript_24876:65-766(+)|eukprot:CAMPEP_0172614312 /NCGR_PEP_ID=MMETSP1068-20121228/49512_1 /TAXON_ID=35684 /ORGANISM="Pseudopedinella elastica, Strain CCMP716" /LENGTH=233 /DNA_ID=CAMNT_0013419057 /DNA_START=55 /DNA_END=756 /DNA_ORIENTATION=+
MEIHCDIPGHGPISSGFKKGPGIKGDSGPLKSRKKALGTLNPNQVFVDPNNPQKSTIKKKGSTESTPRRKLGDISNRGNDIGARKEGKQAAPVVKLTVKPTITVFDDYEYPEIEFSAGRLGHEEEAFLEKQRSTSIPLDFPFGADKTAGAGKKRSKEQEARERKAELLGDLDEADAALEKLSFDAGGAVSLLDDDELDAILNGDDEQLKDNFGLGRGSKDADPDSVVCEDFNF